MDFINRVHWVSIVVRDKRGGLGKVVEFLKWDDMQFDLRMKYDWYFKYRAALLQVKYPKYIVDFASGNNPAKEKSLEFIQMNERKKKITALKTKISKSKSKLDAFTKEFHAYCASYKELFPIKDQPEFKKYVESISFAESKIDKMKKELLNI